MRTAPARPRLRPWLRLAAGVLLAAAPLACQRTGTVSGKVTYQDRAVVYGTVLVVANDGTIHQAAIQEDGSYSVPGVGAGEARLAVNSPDPNAGLVTKPGQKGSPNPEEAQRRIDLKAKWFPIPRDYGDPEKSGLRLSVKGGDNPHDIGLK